MLCTGPATCFSTFFNIFMVPTHTYPKQNSCYQIEAIMYKCSYNGHGIVLSIGGGADQKKGATSEWDSKKSDHLYSFSQLIILVQSSLNHMLLDEHYNYKVP